MDSREAMRANRELARAMGVDVDGIKTVAGARQAFVNGRIDVDQLEARVERILRDGEPPSWDCATLGHLHRFGDAHCRMCGEHRFA